MRRKLLLFAMVLSVIGPSSFVCAEPNVSRVVQLPTDRVIQRGDTSTPALTLMAASAQPSKPTLSFDLTGSWRGAYSYVMTEGAPVNFTVTILMEGGWFSGKISEPNTFSDKTSDQLYANIRGAVMEDGRVIFLKKYDGTAGVSHFVQYEGYLDQRQGVIRGKWLIRPDWWGTFQMKKQ
jgi:hypothetical protein